MSAKQSKAALTDGISAFSSPWQLATPSALGPQEQPARYVEALKECIETQVCERSCEKEIDGNQNLPCLSAGFTWNIADSMRLWFHISKCINEELILSSPLRLMAVLLPPVLAVLMVLW